MGMPVDLAKKIARAIRDYSGTQMATPDGLAGAAIIMAKAAAASTNEKKKRVAKANAAANWQSSCRRLVQIVPEFRQVVTLHLSEKERGSLYKRSRLRSPMTIGSRRLPKE